MCDLVLYVGNKKKGIIIDTSLRMNSMSFENKRDVNLQLTGRLFMTVKVFEKLKQGMSVQNLKKN